MSVQFVFTCILLIYDSFNCTSFLSKECKRDEKPISLCIYINMLFIKLADEPTKYYKQITEFKIHSGSSEVFKSHFIMDQQLTIKI